MQSEQKETNESPFILQEISRHFVLNSIRKVDMRVYDEVVVEILKKNYHLDEQPCLKKSRVRR